jgi:lysozyme
MAIMSYSLNGLHLTEQFESCRLTAYQDVKGIWTVGWGHTGPHVVQGLTITQAQADAFLQGDIQWAANVVNALVKVSLTQPEFDAVVDLVFNIGSGNFASSTLHTLLNANEMAAAANEFEKWDRSGGKEVAGLLRRRVAEENLFKTTFSASYASDPQ